MSSDADVHLQSSEALLADIARIQAERKIDASTLADPDAMEATLKAATAGELDARALAALPLLQAVLARARAHTSVVGGGGEPRAEKDVARLLRLALREAGAAREPSGRADVGRVRARVRACGGVRSSAWHRTNTRCR